MDVPAFEAGPGLCLVLGRNGAGKSTLMEVLAGRRRPHCGDIVVRGQVLSGVRGRAALRRVVGYLPQEARLPGSWTVTEYLSYASWLRGMPRADAQHEAATISALLELDAPDRRTLGSLSGGMRRRVLIGQALVARPALMVLDEPDAGLDRDAAASLALLLGPDGLPRQSSTATTGVADVLARVPVIAAVHRVDEFAAASTQVIDLSATRGTPR